MISTVAAIRATLTAVMTLIAVPVLLVAISGSPVPAGIPSAVQVQAWLDDPLQPQYLPGTARIAAWLIYTLFAALTVVVWVLRARRWQWARVTAYLPGPVQGLAATVLGAATVTTAVGIPPARAATSATSDTAAPSPTNIMTGGITGPAATARPADQGPAKRPTTVTVRGGDTLWSIAADRLGDPHRWKQIYRLNTSHHPHMRGGEHIEAGWVLKLPATAAAPDRRPARPGAITTRPNPTAPPAAHVGPDTAPRSIPTSCPATTPSSASTAPGTGTPAATAAVDPGTATHQDRPPDRPQQPTGGVSLPGGSWLDLGLAVAIFAAVALLWAHRRRRYHPRPLSAGPRLDEGDLTPVPPVVNQIRRWLRSTPDHADETSGPDITEASSLTNVEGHCEEHHDAARPAGILESHGPGGHRDIEEDEELDADPWPAPPPVVPSLAHPLADSWPTAGLGLTGPGAYAAARGLLTAALATGGPHAHDERTCVVMPSATAATLIPPGALPRTPRLRVTAGLDEALDLLEAHTLHRSRLVYAHEVDTLAELRAADPAEEPLPPMMLLATAATRHQRTRITALLAQGQRLDIHGVLLGAWPDGDTIVVDTDGTTSLGDSARHGHHLADLGRLAVLTPADTIAVITTLAETHTGLPQPPPPIEPSRHQHADKPEPAPPNTDGVILPPGEAGRVLTALGDLGDTTAAAIAAHVDLPYPNATAKLVAWQHTGHTETIRADTGQTLWRLTSTGRDTLSAPGTTPAAEPVGADSNADRPNAVSQTDEGVSAAGDRLAEIGTALQWPDPATTFTSEHPQPPAPDAGDNAEKPGRVEVTVLGEAGIVATDPDRRPRRKALELLVYLAVHDGSATVEAILDDLLPDAPASKATERLHTYVSDLRAVMRRNGGPGTYLTHPHQRYTLNPDAVDIDLWRMRAAVREAHQATDPQQRIDALQRAIDCYRGPLADRADYEWAEPYREAIRQQALDAHLALADALTDDPAAQARLLEAAIGHSPYSEHVYQQAMRARATLGHLDAIRTLRRALDRALAEIDAEPSDDTITIADQLIADLQRPRHHTDIEAISGTD